MWRLGIPRYCCALLLSVHMMNTFTRAFNLDITFPTVRQGPVGSYFGYAVAHKRWEGGNVAASERNRVIVGAPKGNGTGVGMGGFTNTGAIYGCDMQASGSCVELSYAPDEPERAVNKTGMWLGVSVAASDGTEGVIIACGHRYQFAQSAAIVAAGQCYRYSMEDSQPEAISPCTEYAINHEDTYFGYCQAGSSLAVSGPDIAIGAPGSRSWKGSFKWVSTDASEFNAMAEDDGSPKNVYLGSSVAVATNLLGDGKPVAASGAPKYKDVGQVLIFSRSKRNSVDAAAVALNISGDQFGSAFGHAIAAIDVRNNGNPSLVVGAPYYRGRNIGGAIYFYNNDGKGINKDTSQKITSRQMTDKQCDELRCEDASFGYSLANVGDINGDGFNDLAVGAPYEGRGAVYIFLGGEKGIRSNYSQRISANDLSNPPLAFGISVAGFASPNNVEGYDGIIVGAYKSDKVYVFRSRPIVRVHAVIKAPVTDIDPLTSSCKSRPGLKMSCFSFSVCFNLMSNRPLLPVRISYKLTGDSGEPRPALRRIQFNEASEVSEISNVTIVPFTVQTCFDQLAFVRDARDLLKPITVSVDFDVNPSKPPGGSTSLLSYPIADDTIPKYAKLDFGFKKSCVTPDCTTDIALSLRFANPEIVLDDNASSNLFVFNSGDIDKVVLTVNVSVSESTNASPAYESVVYADIPPQLLFEAYESAVQSVSCIANASRVICTLPKIMPRGTSLTFSINMKVLSLGSAPSAISVTANTSNPDSMPADNVKRILIRQAIKTDLMIYGQAQGQAFYNNSVKGASAIQYLDEIGELVTHTYTILNDGFGDVERVTVTAEWPYEMKDSGKYLLYMTKDPELVSQDGGVSQCTFDKTKVNPQQYLSRPLSPLIARVPETTAKPRVRRAATGAAVSKDAANQQKRQVTLDCRQGTAKCFNITCAISDFKKKTNRVLHLNGRLWGATLFEEYGHDVDVVHILSRASLYVDPALNIEQPTNNDAAFVSTDAQPTITLPVTEQVAWWIIAVASGAGVLLLVIIIIIFWKCGFFQRHRPMMHEGKVEKKKNEPDYKYEAVPTTEKQ